METYNTKNTDHTEIFSSNGVTIYKEKSLHNSISKNFLQPEIDPDAQTLATYTITINHKSELFTIICQGDFYNPIHDQNTTTLNPDTPLSLTGLSNDEIYRHFKTALDDIGPNHEAYQKLVTLSEQYQGVGRIISDLLHAKTNENNEDGTETPQLSSSEVYENINDFYKRTERLDQNVKDITTNLEAFYEIYTLKEGLYNKAKQERKNLLTHKKNLSNKLEKSYNTPQSIQDLAIDYNTITDRIQQLRRRINNLKEQSKQLSDKINTIDKTITNIEIEKKQTESANSANNTKQDIDSIKALKSEKNKLFNDKKECLKAIFGLEKTQLIKLMHTKNRIMQEFINNDPSKTLSKNSVNYSTTYPLNTHLSKNEQVLIENRIDTVYDIATTDYTTLKNKLLKIHNKLKTI